MNTDLMFSKQSDEWTTPLGLYDDLHREFDFQWDAAATQATSRTGSYCYFGPDHGTAEYRDALTVTPWRVLNRERFFLNPPYSRVREFIAKAHAEAQRGALVVCLVPSRTDTRWWHDHVWDDVRHCWRPGVEGRFLRGRLKFGAATNSAPFPSVVLVFRRA